jgi:hypothetical protein
MTAFSSRDMSSVVVSVVSQKPQHPTNYTPAKYTGTWNASIAIPSAFNMSWKLCGKNSTHFCGQTEEVVHECSIDCRKLLLSEIVSEKIASSVLCPCSFQLVDIVFCITSEQRRFANGRRNVFSAKLVAFTNERTMYTTPCRQEKVNCSITDLEFAVAYPLGVNDLASVYINSLLELIDLAVCVNQVK